MKLTFHASEQFSEITHPEHGHIATFYPYANPRPLVSFTALVWGPMRPRLVALDTGAKYGETRYGLSFDEQLPHDTTIDDALAAVQCRLDRIYAAEAQAAEA